MKQTHTSFSTTVEISPMGETSTECEQQQALAQLREAIKAGRMGIGGAVATFGGLSIRDIIAVMGQIERERQAVGND